MSGKNQGGQRIRISRGQAFRFIIYFAMGESSILTIYYLVGPPAELGAKRGGKRRNKNNLKCGGGGWRRYIISEYKTCAR